METQVVERGRTAKWIVAASVVVVFAGAKALAPLLAPVLLAILLALTIKPLVDWLGRRMKRGLALLLSFVFILALGLGVLSLVGVAIGRLGETLPSYEERLRSVLAGLQTAFAARGIDISGLISSNAMSAERIVGLAQRLVAAARGLLSGGFLILFLLVLFLAEMPFLEKLADRDRSRKWIELTGGIQKYIALTGFTGAINALLNLVLLLAIGVDFPVLWAVVCFFFNFVPAVGNIIALAPPALLALLEFGWQRALLVVLGFFVTNLSMDMILKPRLMKTSLELSPLLIILSLMFWSWLLGPVGTILAIPLTMVMQRGFFTRPVAEPSGGERTARGASEHGEPVLK